MILLHGYAFIEWYTHINYIELIFFEIFCEALWFIRERSLYEEVTMKYNTIIF